MKAARSAVIEIADGGLFYTREHYKVLVNGKEVMETETVITSLFDLKPETSYQVVVEKQDKTEAGSVEFTTDYEFVTLNVKDFGAKGDGIQDDTKYIQAAILSCPAKSRVLVPAGVYKITSLFLKSNLNLELAEGAELLADTERYAFPKLPALIESYDETDEYNLGTWEGNPLPMFAGIITGIGVEHVLIYGKGTINGNASKENWWKNPKVMEGAFRPRLFFINHCSDITMQGVTCCNSPSWTLHPHFSNQLGFYNVTVKNPSDSPNTDGLDPESCKDVEIMGVRFSLGDDCIAVKSGKIYMGKKHKTPSENIHIRQCLMENGHGAVTVGSEMAGGVKNLVVEECLFSHTDRGLRIKTRRGRGEDAVLDEIVFRKIAMDHVMTPFVVNCFYFCDPDGKTEYVQSRKEMPVDDRTPSVKRLVFEDIDAKNCHVAAAHFDGLPEQKIEEIVMKNVKVSYAENPKCDVPAMSEGVEACSLKGIFASNVKKLTLQNVDITGQNGEAVTLQGVDDGALTPGLALYLKRIFAENSLDVAVLGCYLNLANPNEESIKKNQKRYLAHIRFASLLGVGVVGTETGAVNERYSFEEKNHSEETLEIFIKNLRPVVEYAEKMGVIMAIEPVFKHIVWNPKRARKVLDTIVFRESGMQCEFTRHPVIC